MGAASTALSNHDLKVVEGEAGVSPRHKPADESGDGIDPRIKTFVFMWREAGVHAIVISAGIWAMFWSGPNLLMPMVDSFKTGPKILEQSIEANKNAIEANRNLTAAIQAMSERESRTEARMQIFMESLSNNVQILIRRTEPKAN